MMEAKLLPCPFCGPGQSQVSSWFDDSAHRWRVSCGRCGCSTGTSPRDKTEAPAIAAWNTRPAVNNIDRITAERGGLVEEIAALKEEVAGWKAEHSRLLDDVAPVLTERDGLRKALTGAQRFAERVHELSGERFYLNGSALIQELCRKQIESTSTALASSLPDADGSPPSPRESSSDHGAAHG